VRFVEPVEGPGVNFRVVSEDGSLAYSMQTVIGERWRRYDAGAEAEVRIRFRPRLGGGGTFHLSVDVTDHVATILATDLDGPSFYVPPLYGVGGPADLECAIALDGAPRTNFTWNRIEGGPAVAMPANDEGAAELPAITDGAAAELPATPDGPATELPAMEGGAGR